MDIRATFRRLYWLLSAQFGIDPIKMFRSLQGLPRYVRDYFRFRADYTGRLQLLPCLHDWHEEGGSAQSEYFWQDLLVARMIWAAAPQRHVDIGSRVDGFVAHVASFREIEVIDVRPNSAQVPGVTFKQADLMAPVSWAEEGYCDSLSCLHAIEHFGLGRYGDPIHGEGYQRGIAHLAKLLKPGGTFYLSAPVGQERVEFNAHRIFNPVTIISCANANNLTLQKLTVVNDATGPQEVTLSEEVLMRLAQDKYNLGIFVFTKSELESA